MADGRAPARVFRSIRSPLAALACAVGAVGCGTSTGPPLSGLSPSKNAVLFDYVAIDGSHLSSETTCHRVTVIALVTTYDIASQVVVQELVELIHTHEPRINVGLVVLEPPRNAPLAEAYAHTLELPFPVALADAATLGARGPFGAVSAVPTLVVLDPRGVETWRHTGAVSVETLRAAVDRAF